MHRIDTKTAQKDKFGAGKNGFTRGNPQTGTPATDLDDDYFDMLQEELCGVVEASGASLEKGRGVGAEYWRDYLKLSANGYIRASGWKKSPDIEDYQERPANGWDIRAEGYLPAWPQLGASLMYEQYYGDEVGLFGKDKRQKDPHAISAEVTYTPVPLLTLSAGHKQGKSGENDTRFGLEVNYRIGEPLAKQLDTDSIRERRVLAGSRYDLVERNNNIVLEYRSRYERRSHGVNA